MIIRDYTEICRFKILTFFSKVLSFTDQKQLIWLFYFIEIRPMKYVAFFNNAHCAWITYFVRISALDGKTSETTVMY